jgi:hypothetical protein
MPYERQIASESKKSPKSSGTTWSQKINQETKSQTYKIKVKHVVQTLKRLRH